MSMNFDGLARDKTIRQARERGQVAEWGFSRSHDHLLREGIEKGMSFNDYSKKTGCPEPLRERYEDLADEYRVAERRRNDPFLKGFMGQGGD